MSFPLYIIGGGAGSGKDTVAEMMVHRRSGVMIAQADPMKRFVKAGFNFTNAQLWGPSASRNAVDPRFEADPVQEFSDANARIFYSDLAERWLSEIGAPGAFRALVQWFENLKDKYTGGEKQLTPRATLQLLGTEFGRAVDPDIWSNLAISYSSRLLRGGLSYDKTVGLFKDEGNPGHRFAVITDGRFRNEFLNVKALGGKAFQVFNPADEADKAKVEQAGVAGHASEAELRAVPRDWYNFIIENDKSKGLESLQVVVDQIMGHELDLEFKTYQVGR